MNVSLKMYALETKIPFAPLLRDRPYKGQLGHGVLTLWMINMVMMEMILLEQ